MTWRYALGIALFAPVALAGDPGATIPPKVLHKTDPIYTREARRAAVQGTVLLEAVIDEHGVPTKLTVLSPLGFGLDAHAIEAVSQWQFEPGKKAGQPVVTTTIVPVDFRL